MPEFYQPLRDFLTERYTLLLEIGVEETDELRFYVEVCNQTKDVPLIVHDVRVHYGSANYSHFFRLLPVESVTIPPKERFRFVLGYQLSEIIVGKRYLTKEPAIISSADRSGPSFDSPAGLFNAIGMGKASDSWIEINFNQYKQRRYKKGKIKCLFDNIGKTMRLRRPQSNA